MATSEYKYHPIADYALISDCHCVALVCRTGSIDWCCMPRVDTDSSFGRLLDSEKGGYYAITPTAPAYTSSRRYLPGTMILETTFHTEQGEARLYDYFQMDADADEHAHYSQVRLLEGVSGSMEFQVKICPRFDYGETIPHMQKKIDGIYTAIGSDKGMIIHADISMEILERRDLTATLQIHSGEKTAFYIRFAAPENVDEVIKKFQHGDVPHKGFEKTKHWWEQWSQRMQLPHQLDKHTLRSAIVLKSLTYERTGAIVAAATTSLPEWIGGERNWDYRYCWVRDSVFTVRALYELGYNNEAECFLRFIKRACAGTAKQLQIMYAVDGKRRLTEFSLDHIEGYRASKPVRIGNSAAKQNQLDIFGELLEMANMWNAKGNSIEAEYWDFLQDVINTVCDEWQDHDYGIWEFRGGPKHYVHSKALCWNALKHGINLAKTNHLPAPLDKWIKTRDQIRSAIESHGYDDKRGIFVQAFENEYLDAALLLLPHIGFVDYRDPRMMRTVDAICEKLDRGGLLVRYSAPDGLPGKEGAFLPCTFWLVSCLAYQGKQELAWKYYRRAISCANDVGLFSEEFDVHDNQMLGNFPQGLTHVSQIMARMALAQTDHHPEVPKAALQGAEK
jgi:GH15 family glucan-1,4-alpha-glucosidase